MHKECCVCTLTNECLRLAKPKKSAFAGIRQERKTWFKIVAMEEETEFSSTGTQVEGFACRDELKENHWRTLRRQLSQESYQPILPHTVEWEIWALSLHFKGMGVLFLKKGFLGL